MRFQRNDRQCRDLERLILGRFILERLILGRFILERFVLGRRSG
jgi:hypothetical protein